MPEQFGTASSLAAPAEFSSLAWSSRIWRENFTFCQNRALRAPEHGPRSRCSWKGSARCL